jgi:hypothetical protein
MELIMIKDKFGRDIIITENDEMNDYVIKDSSGDIHLSFPKNTPQEQIDATIEAVAPREEFDNTHTEKVKQAMSAPILRPEE